VETELESGGKPGRHRRGEWFGWYLVMMFAFGVLGSLPVAKVHLDLPTQPRIEVDFSESLTHGGYGLSHLGGYGLREPVLDATAYLYGLSSTGGEAIFFVAAFGFFFLGIR